MLDQDERNSVPLAVLPSCRVTNSLLRLPGDSSCSFAGHDHRDSAVHAVPRLRGGAPAVPGGVRRNPLPAVRTNAAQLSIVSTKRRSWVCIVPLCLCCCGPAPASTPSPPLRFICPPTLHLCSDKERGVVWEESIILAPQSVRFAFLSATIPNAREFADWVRDPFVQCLLKRCNVGVCGSA